MTFQRQFDTNFLPKHTKLKQTIARNKLSFSGAKRLLKSAASLKFLSPGAATDSVTLFSPGWCHPGRSAPSDATMRREGQFASDEDRIDDDVTPAAEATVLITGPH